MTSAFKASHVFKPARRARGDSVTERQSYNSAGARALPRLRRGLAREPKREERSMRSREVSPRSPSPLWEGLGVGVGVRVRVRWRRTQTILDNGRYVTVATRRRNAALARPDCVQTPTEAETEAVVHLRHKLTTPNTHFRSPSPDRTLHCRLCLSFMPATQAGLCTISALPSTPLTTPRTNPQPLRSCMPQRRSLISTALRFFSHTGYGLRQRRTALGQ